MGLEGIQKMRVANRKKWVNTSYTIAAILGYLSKKYGMCPSPQPIPHPPR